MQADPQKIEERLNELNSGLSVPAWIVIDGYYALTKMEIKPDGAATFVPNQGIPLKSFVNINTGELKIFHVKALRAGDGN